MSGAGEAAVEQTDVGSYFVANYPPFSVVEGRGRRRCHAPERRSSTTARPSRAGRSGLYLHIPFCRKRCHFCYFRVYTDKNAREVEQYLDLLAREWELYAATPAVAGRAIQLRLLRRRHAVVPVDQAAAGPGRPPQRERRVEQRRGDHVRVRARHASPKRSWRRSASWASRASASASRTSTIASSRSTAARIARRKSAAPTTRRARSASRRSTST